MILVRFSTQFLSVVRLFMIGLETDSKLAPFVPTPILDDFESSNKSLQNDIDKLRSMNVRYYTFFHKRVDSWTPEQSYLSVVVRFNVQSGNYILTVYRFMNKNPL